MSTPKPVPAQYADLAEQPITAALATTLPNGTPQVTPLWFSYTDGFFYFNTAVGRLKDKAIRENPYVALMVLDPKNPYRYLQVRGPIEIIEDPAEARAHINELCEHYTGSPVYTFGPPDEPRVKFKLTPEFVNAQG